MSPGITGLETTHCVLLVRQEIDKGECGLEEATTNSGLVMWHIISSNGGIQLAKQAHGSGPPSE